MLDKSLQAFHFLTRLRLQHQVRCQLRHLPPDNLLEEGELSEIDLAMFKKVLAFVAELQARVKVDFPG